MQSNLLKKNFFCKTREKLTLVSQWQKTLDEVAQLEIELINLQTQSFSTRKRLATGIETLRVEQRTKEKADADCKTKSNLHDEQKALDKAAEDDEKRLKKEVAEQKESRNRKTSNQTKKVARCNNHLHKQNNNLKWQLLMQ